MTVQERLTEILSLAGQTGSPIRATELYNEGWMLRLLLDHLSQLPRIDHPFRFWPAARWYSEALLPSPFLSRHRGDELAEGWTNADGAVGHFEISQAAKGDLSLLSEAEQFVVIEAKMFSGLSAGVKRCTVYNQAARNVACIAEVLARKNCQPASLSRLAFVVVAPAVQIKAGIFGQRCEKESIQQTVQARVDCYAGKRDQWFREWFLPTLAAIEVQLVSWEEVLKELPASYHTFYDDCLRHNRSAAKANY